MKKCAGGARAARTSCATKRLGPTRSSLATKPRMTQQPACQTMKGRRDAKSCAFSRCASQLLGRLSNMNVGNLTGGRSIGGAVPKSRSRGDWINPIVHTDQRAALNAEPFATALFERAVERCGHCAAVDHGQLHGLRRAATADARAKWLNCSSSPYSLTGERHNPAIHLGALRARPPAAGCARRRLRVSVDCHSSACCWSRISQQSPCPLRCRRLHSSRPWSTSCPLSRPRS
ncbi:hypothetical protein ACVIHF_000898 [Bradyrhizobium sp. USDA 4506]